MARFLTSPGFWKAVFSLVTFQHWTHWTLWIPSRNLPGNTQGCYPRGNACPSGSVQRFPDRWEVGHVTWTYDEKYLEVSMTYLVWSRYLSLDFGRAHLVDKILECWRNKSRMVMEVLNSMKEICMLPTSEPRLGGISAAPKVLSSPLSFKSGRCNEYDRPISDDTTGFLGWTNGHPLLKDSLYPAPL